MKYKKSVYQSLVLITQFGINMIVPIFLCTGLGIFIDKKSGLGFFIIPLFILGALAGFRNCYIVAKKIYESDDKKHDKTEKITQTVKKDLTRHFRLFCLGLYSMVCWCSS